MASGHRWTTICVCSVGIALYSVPSWRQKSFDGINLQVERWRVQCRRLLRPEDERREQFYARLMVDYGAQFSESLAFHEQACSVLVGGGSHTARLSDPFPAWMQTARGAHVSDLDGHTILDFWQGHFANLLGHNPPEISAALVESLQAGHGLQSGMQDTLEWELADLLCGVIGAEKARFTTSGSLATMYAVLLARVYTGRNARPQGGRRLAWGAALVTQGRGVFGPGLPGPGDRGIARHTD